MFLRRDRGKHVGIEPGNVTETVRGRRAQNLPWPTPLPPDASVMTFSGNGDATTQEFALQSDAAPRIAVEKGPMALRVLKSDGTEGATLRPIPTSGFGAGRNPTSGHLHTRSANVGPLGRDGGVQAEQIKRIRQVAYRPSSGRRGHHVIL
jgi:hypothetical protein